MRQMQRYSRFFAVGALALAGAAAVACTGSTTPDIPPPSSSPTEPTTDPGAEGRDTPLRPDAGESGSTSEPNASDICTITRSYFEACGNASELSCGSKGFDAWCAQNDKLVSNAFRDAEAHCLTTKNCDGTARRVCDYGRYNGEKQTASQKALVKAYCQTCGQDDVTGCMKNSIRFDENRGLDAVPDIFVAAWELSDDLVDSIRKSCTGSALHPPPGPNDGPNACADAFASCAGAIYVDRIPECSK